MLPLLVEAWHQGRLVLSGGRRRSFDRHEPVDFCGKSHINQLSQGSVNKVPATGLQKEDLAVVV
jgi:hypothetical protein